MSKPKHVRSKLRFSEGGSLIRKQAAILAADMAGLFVAQVEGASAPCMTVLYASGALLMPSLIRCPARHPKTGNSPCRSREVYG